jgi:hypothetical protein
VIIYKCFKLQAEKLKTEAQNELGALHEQIAETNGQLEVQMHLNKSRAQEVIIFMLLKKEKIAKLVVLIKKKKAICL